jgi:hypothetical protein
MDETWETARHYAGRARDLRACLASFIFDALNPGLETRA